MKKYIAYVLITAVVILISLIYIFNVYLKPRIISVSKRFAENEISMIVDEEIKELMLNEFLSYDKITLIQRDADGRINSVSINSVLINNFANDLDIKIGNRVDTTDAIENSVYLSSLIGSDFLCGFGPKIPIRFQPISVTNADITHSFEEAGINQTIHSVILTVSIDVEILMPFSHSTITVNSQMPIAQTLIVGTVPDTYFNKK